MFVRRQDLIDQFESNFRETEDGGILFQPRRAKIGLPITWDDYQAVTAAFERVQMINMGITWAVFLGAGGFGLYKLISEDRYAPFLVALGIATVFSFCLQVRDTTGLLMPFIQGREELEKSLEAKETMAAPSAKP